MNLTFIKRVLLVIALPACTGLSSCSLQEKNPSGFTMESVAKSSVDGYMTLVNNCYFGMERGLYGWNEWMMLCEAGTDIWTYQKNANAWAQYFKYGAGASVELNVGSRTWNSCYDGIGSCNLAIKYAEIAPFNNTEDKKRALAQVYFLRAMYYYNLVEQFGGVTVITEPATTVNLRPEKTAPLDVYKQVIIPDLEYAAEWLPVNNGITKPSKKSALGFLARAYLQTVAYDDTKAYASKALTLARDLITDAEGGGGKYNTHLYPTFDEVFKESNNYENRESLWSHRFVKGGISNSAWYLNRNNELFYAVVTDFGAMKQDGTDMTTWGRRSSGQFMPSHHLLNLFVQNDGTLDPRYHKSFQTSWTANRPSYKWTDANIKTFDRGASVTTSTQLVAGNRSIEFIHSNDPDYAAKVADKLNNPFLVVDYNDVYDPVTKKVKMQYSRVNHPLAGGGTLTTNPFWGFYPSLSKHNSSNYALISELHNLHGNLSATFIMRMAEVYLIAAEADIYVNGGSGAAGYINTIRTRAGARPLNTASIQDVLDERARELCGEYVRYYDLRRTKKLSKAYLNQVNPDVGQFFTDGTHEVRPMPLAFLTTLQDGGVYYQNPGY